MRQRLSSLLLLALLLACAPLAAAVELRGFPSSPVFTQARVPLLIGGTGTTSTLTLRSTSGVGAAGADIVFQVGNNGATEAMRIENTDGILSFGQANLLRTAHSRLYETRDTVLGDLASGQQLRIPVVLGSTGSATQMHVMRVTFSASRGANSSHRMALDAIVVAQVQETTLTDLQITHLVTPVAVAQDRFEVVHTGAGWAFDIIIRNTHAFSMSEWTLRFQDIGARLVSAPVVVRETATAYVAMNISNSLRVWGTGALSFIADDVTRVTINSTGLGSGSTTPQTKVHASETGTATVRGILSAQYNSDVHAAQVIGRKARGTEGTPTIITTGDGLLGLVGEGYDGASYLQMAAIEMASTGTIASTRVPTRILFRTATDAAPSVLTTLLELRIGTQIGVFGVTPVVRQANIVDADGTLADITTKFNTLLTALEAYGWLTP